MLSPPQTADHLVVTYYPSRKALLLRLNRPEQLNAMNDALEADLCAVLDWAEEETSIWTIIITGTGRMFCAGQDLKNWLATSKTRSQRDRVLANRNGFASIARRRSKKTLIVALNGHSFGGGTELLLNCDIIISTQTNIICLPEVRRGVVASVGGIPNLMTRSPMLVPYLLSGTPIPQHLLEAHILTDVVAADQVLPKALEWATKIAECSPEAVWVSKEQINLFKDGKGIQDIVSESAQSAQSVALYDGDNLQEGLRSFAEKRATMRNDPPKLVKSKL